MADPDRSLCSFSKLPGPALTAPTPNWEHFAIISKIKITLFYLYTFPINIVKRLIITDRGSVAASTLFTSS